MRLRYLVLDELETHQLSRTVSVALYTSCVLMSLSRYNILVTQRLCPNQSQCNACLGVSQGKKCERNSQWAIEVRPLFSHEQSFRHYLLKLISSTSLPRSFLKKHAYMWSMVLFQRSIVIQNSPKGKIAESATTLFISGILRVSKIHGTVAYIYIYEVWYMYDMHICTSFTCICI